MILEPNELFNRKVIEPGGAHPVDELRRDLVIAQTNQLFERLFIEPHRPNFFDVLAEARAEKTIQIEW